MPWIKRNIVLVISGVVALGLLGFGGWYLWTANNKNTDVDQSIGTTKAEIERLLNMDPTPSPANLTAAKSEAARLTGFIAEGKKHFPPSPNPPQPLDNQTFKSLLETTINNLHKEASDLHVKLSDSNYYFTFENQRLPVVFAPESLRPLTERLHEVEVMSGILFSSGINHLVGMRRSPVPGERPGGGPGPGPGGATSDYIGGVRTNADSGMVVWPYELTFDCFSGELGAVIEKFQSASEAFLVRSPMIEPAERVSAGVNRPAPPGRQFPPGRQITNAGPAPLLTTVVNERLMRVTLRVDVIRPESFQPGGPGPGPGNFRPGGGRGGRGGGPNQMNLPPGGGSGNPPPPAGGKP